MNKELASSKVIGRLEPEEVAEEIVELWLTEKLRRHHLYQMYTLDDLIVK